MHKVVQVAAWLLAAAIVGLSLLPPATRPVTGTGQSFEHATIFLSLGVAYSIGYSHRAWRLVVGLLTFAAVVELLQLLVPGRHARLSDFLIDGTASCLGIGLSQLALRLSRHRI